MRWSRLAYCAALVALTTLLVVGGVTPWLSVPIGAFAAYWTTICTHALWSLASFRVAAWGLHQAPSPSIDDLPRKAKQWEWLFDPKPDGLVDALTVGRWLVAFSHAAVASANILADDLITTNQAAIINLFRVINRYVGNLAPMPGVFLNYPLR
jgi:hypothetical protein